ncbi:MAG: hypothetical protein U5L09_21805 [Bacteroidales bacterium]|nr:hypothetical protein [Bacteroidales bacterium]
MAETQKQYITELRNHFGNKTSEVPMQQSEVKGVENIALLGEIAFEGTNSTPSGVGNLRR